MKNQITVALLIGVLLIGFFFSFPQIPVYADTDVYTVSDPRTDVERLGVNPAPNNCGPIACSSRFIGEVTGASSSLNGQSINKITITLEKATDGQTLSGTLYFGVWDPASGAPTTANALYSFGSRSANTIADGPTQYSFTSIGSPYTITSNDAIGVFYDGALTTESGIFVSGRSVQFDGTNTFSDCYVNAQTNQANSQCFSFATCGQSATWCSDTTYDTIMIMTITLSQEECVINPETVFCRLGGGTDDVTGLGGLVGDSVVTLGCNVIFVDCSEDTNPATNGLGLLIFIASIFVVIGMFYWSMGTRAFEMPFFIWVVIILSLSAFFTIIGLIDPVFLIISIIAIVALCAPKILSTVRGTTFGGGSTE